VALLPGARFFTKLDLAMACMQLRIRDETSTRRLLRAPQPLVFRVGGTGRLRPALQHSIFGCPVLSFDSAGRVLPLSGAEGSSRSTESTLPRPCWGPGASWRCTVITSSSCRKRAKRFRSHHSGPRVLNTLQHHKLYAKASKCQFISSSVGFLGHVFSEHGVIIIVMLVY
jgi:hypothetical protein